MGSKFSYIKMNKIKFFIKSVVYKINSIRPIIIGYALNNSLLPSIISKTESIDLRNILFLPKGPTNSQLNQDIFALLVNNFKEGYFVEIGANDGFNLSNTEYLESAFGWQGLLIEANPKYKESLKKRKARVEICLLYTSDAADE